jgi:hypothetical protein
MAGLRNPLSTLRHVPRGTPRMTRGRCDSLRLHRRGLSPLTSCRSPGAPVHPISCDDQASLLPFIRRGANPAADRHMAPPCASWASARSRALDELRSTGLRGDLGPVGKLKQRVEHDIKDIDIEKWLIWLDLRIILLTLYLSTQRSHRVSKAAAYRSSPPSAPMIFRVITCGS